MSDADFDCDKSKVKVPKNQLLEAIIAEGKNLTQSFICFVEQFYISFFDNGAKEAGMLLCIARDIYNILDLKTPKKTKIRIFNPTVKDDGWQSGFTVVQILSDDMPFLVDSFTEKIKSSGYKIEQRINSVLAIERNEKGKMQKIYPLKEKEGKTNESLIYFAINKIDKHSMHSLSESLMHVSQLVSSAVNDWKKMCQSVDDSVCGLACAKKDLSAASEIQTFLKWMKQDNFVFLGYAEYLYRADKMLLDKKSILGVAKVEETFKESEDFSDGYKSYAYITRSDKISSVHRVVNMDLIRVKVFDKDESLVGEKRFLGLFTSAVYYQNIRFIPIIRKKLEEIEKRAQFIKGAHNNKALVAIMQNFPRVELLHISTSELYKTCIDMISLSIKPRFKLFVNRDPVGSFARFIIFVPSKQFSIKLADRMKQYLIEEFKGVVSDEYIVMSDSDLVRLQLILKVKRLNEDLKDKTIENELYLMAKDWGEGLKNILNEKTDMQNVDSLCARYVDAFPESYKEAFDPLIAYSDIQKLEKISEENPIEASLYEFSASEEYHLKIYFLAGKLQLYHLIPVIENMSMRVIEHYSYKIKKSGYAWIQYFVLKPVEKTLFDLSSFKEKFEIGLVNVLSGGIENDYYNSLIVIAGLDYKEVLLLRTFGSYIKQICFNYSPNYIQTCLSKHPEACVLIIKLFHTRFCSNNEDENQKQEKISILKDKIEGILAKIDNLVDDKIIRMFVELCFAILRTNYYLQKKYVSIKIRSKEISNIPLPKPFAEIYVYSHRFEGIHLRGGKVSRGGIRWSDRTEDFRTEILGLMKAQMPKNAAIVPVGSKGGFVLKDAPEDKSLKHKTAVECYKDFLRGLLDITDNIVEGQNISTKHCICYDDFDPYLVVAADKGTATFSNYANEISKEYNFWLFDAFASGGSSGYDHKKLAITSSGAWVSMQLRFWERFGSIKKESFTVVGIGDMSGDVFGNGMLLSEDIQLVAAFNHMHIFVDPKPNIKKSFSERKRMFKMQGSTWLDYDSKIISEGGGVFSRQSKLIPVSKQMMELFGLCDEKVSPNDLIKAILTADVDVIWNGGIGTYIKSSTESNEDVGDKANDNLRVNGKDVKAKIVAEGGNLGCTQLGRIEYSRNGGLINTDFIDNCAGVCCSDMEVNIKIAFAELISKNQMTLDQRDKILFEMESEVTKHILKNTNQAQSALLMAEDLNAKNQLEQHQLLLNKLEKIGLIDRNIEFLPTNQEIKRMFVEGIGFARPQIALLISYAKMHLYDKILASDLPDNSFFNSYLVDYFPTKMQKEFNKQILKHPLKREIIATCIANTMMNKVGCTFINNAVENTGFSTKEVVRVLATVYEIYKLEGLFEELMLLVGKIDVTVFFCISLEYSHFINQTVYWFLRNYPQPMKIGLAVKELSQDIGAIIQSIPEILDAESQEEYHDFLDKLVKDGLSKTFAKNIAKLKFLGSALAIVQISNNLRFYSKIQVPLRIVGKIYFQVGSELYLTMLRSISMKKCENGSYWERLSVRTLSDELYDKQMLFTSEIAKYLDEDENYVNALDLWKKKNAAKLKRYNQFFNDLKAIGGLDVSKLVMLVKRLDSIIKK